MRLHRWISLISCGLLLSAVVAQDTTPTNPPPKTDDQSGVQVENRGPVHEAFANPGAAVRGGEKTGFSAPKAPPPPVPELPPDEKPSGNNVQWISGYWQYDQEKKDFIWVSGFWRNMPPGRAWAAGEWRVENGEHRYIPGYWKPANESNWRIDLPKPPESVEAGPNVPAPHKDAHWIPGHWVYRDDNYAWRPGYWGELDEGMLWTPSQYVYTGSGYRFVPGYWDYCFEDRGLLYAPVYFNSPLWLNPGWRYRPTFGINIGFGGGWGWGYGGFYNNLFIGPGYGSFWFGNFGGFGYWGAGYRPWCWTGGRGFCNPHFNSYCWLNRGNPGWRNNVQQNFAARTVGVIPGPGRTVAGNTLGRGGNINPATLNGATQLVSKLGGEKAGQTLADRVNKGQMISEANRAVKQTGSNTIVQPAKEVLRNQNVARNLPTPASSSNKVTLDSMKGSSRPSFAGNDAALRNSINSAVRSAPSGSITRSSGTDSMPRSNNSMSNRTSGGLDAMRGSNRSFENITRGSSGGSSSSSLGRGSSLPSTGSSRGTFNPSSGGSSMGRSSLPPSGGAGRSMGGSSSGGGASRGGFGGGGGGGGGSRGGGKK